MSPITLIIIALTVFISYRAMNNPSLKYQLALYPYKIKNQSDQKRIVTHMFVHGDYLHLIFNMYVFYSFGSLMELILTDGFGGVQGSVHFLFLYFLGGIAASLWPIYRNHNNPNYLSLGASGAVSAVLFATILWYPQGKIGMLFLPGISIPSWIFGLLYLGFEFYMSKRNQSSGIAHDAHFGGAIFGILYTLIISPERGELFIDYVLS